MELCTAFLGQKLGKEDFIDVEKKKEALARGLEIIRQVEGVKINSENDFSCTASVWCWTKEAREKLEKLLKENGEGFLENAFFDIKR